MLTLSLLLGALVGCGASQPAATGAARNNGPAAPTRTSVPPAAPTPAATPALDPAALVGKVLFGLGDNNAACSAALAGTPPPGLPTAADASSGGSGSAAAVATGVGTLIPGGILILSCASDSSSGPSALIAFNLLTRAVAWTVSLNGYDTYDIGSQHLFLVSHTTTPPAGLQGAQTTYKLTAVDLATGATSWTAPFFADGTGYEDQGIYSLDEGPSGVPGHPDAVVITYLGTSAYDAGTGANLWHIGTMYETQASGFYITGGVEEVYGHQDNDYDGHITGFDARTGRQLWDLRLPVRCVAATGRQTDVLVGTVEWEFSPNCVQAHSVTTGDLITDREFPSSWQSVAATPDRLLEYGGSTLAMFSTTDQQHPLWSENAASTTPLAISAGHVLVQAPSGLLVLSATDGSITSTVPATLFAGNGSYAEVDGLVVQSSINGETSVLELDPPQSK